MAHLIMDAVDISGGATVESNSIFLAEPKTEFSVEGSYVDANSGISAMSIKLQASGDGRSVTDANANWHDIQTYALVAGDITAKTFAFIEATGGPFKRYRVQMSASTGHGAGDTLTARLIEGLN
jgi:hypothetical protein